MSNIYRDTKTIRDSERRMFTSVMKHFYDLRGAIGSCGAIDYSVMQGGSGPKYSDHEKGVSTINFVADVEKIAAKKLNAEEYGLFKAQYLAKFADLDIVIDELHANLRAKLGRLFSSHDLYPVAKYFGRI